MLGKDTNRRPREGKEGKKVARSEVRKVRYREEG